jgi:hypothetical protein
MAKKKTAKRGEYEEPLKVKGTFSDIIKAAAKNANDNSEKKRKAKEEEE